MSTHITDDGIRLSVYDTMYDSFGLHIERVGADGEEDKTLFLSPHALSCDSYGRKPAERFDGDWDDAEAAEAADEPDCFVPWTEDDWIECLKHEADEFIDAWVTTEDD